MKTLVANFDISARLTLPDYYDLTLKDLEGRKKVYAVTRPLALMLRAELTKLLEADRS